MRDDVTAWKKRLWQGYVKENMARSNQWPIDVPREPFSSIVEDVFLEIDEKLKNAEAH